MIQMQSQALERFQQQCKTIVQRRLGVFVIGVLSAVLFPVLLLSLNNMQQQQVQLGKTLENIQANLSQLAEVERLYAIFTARNVEFGQLATEIEQRGLVTGDWTVREIKLTRLEATRAEAEIYLDSIAQSPAVYFIPEHFEAKVADSKDDLFRWQQNSKDSVFVTIFGRYYSRKPQ